MEGESTTPSPQSSPLSLPGWGPRAGVEIPGWALPPKMAGEEELIRPVLSSNIRRFSVLSIPNT